MITKKEIIENLEALKKKRMRMFHSAKRKTKEMREHYDIDIRAINSKIKKTKDGTFQY